MLLPFGVYGPYRFETVSFHSGSTAISPTTGFLKVVGDVPTDYFAAGTTTMVNADNIDFGTVSIVFPAVGIRTVASTVAGSGSDGADPTTTAYYSLQVGKTATSNVTDPGYADYLRALSNDIISDSEWSDSLGLTARQGLSHQWTFTLDELVVTTGSTFTDANPTNNITSVAWTAGSYASGTSWNATGSGGRSQTGYPKPD